MRQDLHNKAVVITGAARGIGRELAKQLSNHGAKLALIGLEPEALASLVREVSTPAHYWEVDVTRDDEMLAVVPFIIEKFGSIDIVIANAGLGEGAAVEYSQAQAYNKIIEVNLIGSVNTARAFAAELKKTKGYFLQIASLAALVTTPFLSAYCASKAGVDAFARCFSYELDPYGVTVGVAYLSWADTDMVRTADKNPRAKHMRAMLPWPFNKTYPLDSTVHAIVQGIIHRKHSIYVQKWVGILNRFRGVTYNTLTCLFTRKAISNLDAQELSDIQPQDA